MLTNVRFPTVLARYGVTHANHLQAMNEPKRTLESIFHAAKELSEPERREAFLRDVGRDDPGLRDKVEGLLRASAEADVVFAARATAVPEDRPTFIEGPAMEGPGSRIGRYKLLQQIGEGGCGTVFMAEQQEPVRRRVALKVIKLGMDTKSVVARFEAERQALALMDHPNIAKVLDAGATDSGRPFFVMELVRGQPITRYCDQHRLRLPQRLELFVQVCQAIQHAHQKGIIHRDVKPSNILVTEHDGRPVPKVIDFGIAKATEGRLTDRTMFTAFEMFIGTPAYMSPEQAELSGMDVDTRSDIYSLGVVLYELLTGRTPFDTRALAQAGLDAIRKTIREMEPAKPSTCLATLEGEALTTMAQALGADRLKLPRLVRGDLDWIVMKCLEKDRSRRYETANALFVDILRHLRHEPIAACPPSAIYRLRKVVQRNRLACAAGAIVTVSLIGGLMVSVLLLARAQEAEARAEAAASQAKGLAATEHETRLYLCEWMAERVFQDLRKTEPASFTEVGIDFGQHASPRSLLVVGVDRPEGRERRQVLYAREFLELLDKLAEVLAREQDTPGNLTEYLRLCTSANGIARLPASSRSVQPSVDFKNARTSSLHGLLGTTLALALQLHRQGHVEGAAAAEVPSLLNGLPGPARRAVAMSGVRRALDAAYAPDAYRRVAKALAGLERRPPWAVLFLPEAQPASEWIRLLEQVEIDFFTGPQ